MFLVLGWGRFRKCRFCRYLEKVRGGTWRWRNLNLLSDRFWNYFSQIQSNCKENVGELGFLRILFLYRIMLPYFPTWGGPIFHVALFLTPDHPPLAAAISVRQVTSFCLKKQFTRPLGFKTWIAKVTFKAGYAGRICCAQSHNTFRKSLPAPTTDTPKSWSIRNMLYSLPDTAASYGGKLTKF